MKLVPYVTGGVTDNWTDYLTEAAAHADMIEIGLPFSDPTLDGPVIQQASDQALRRGTTVDGILDDVRKLDLDTPLYAMTYANLVRDDLCARLREAGFRGLIVPDLPVDEAGDLAVTAERESIELVLLASPATKPERLQRIAESSRGWVYAVSNMGTTGERRELAGLDLVRSLKQLTDLPVLLGFGISTEEHVAQARGHADGVVVGSAVMRRVLDGAAPQEVGAFLARLRSAGV